MGILGAYADDAIRTANTLATLPTEAPQAAQRSAWTAPFRGVGAAAVESAGNVLDMAGAFGSVMAATQPFRPATVPMAQDDAKQSMEAFDKLMREGPDFRPQMGQDAYSLARGLRADPATASAAELAVSGFIKGLTKAIGGTLLLGPAGGAAAVGASEGMTQAEDLAVAGVDQATRAKVGSVVGVATGAGAMIPVAGKSLASTAAMIAAGGPALFMAQQQASREILKGADYGALAEQFDPLDPLGLALSALVPAGFAAYLKRGQIAAAMRKPAAHAGNEPPTIVPAPTQDAIDATMTHNLTAQADAVAAREADTGIDPWLEPFTFEQRVRNNADVLEQMKSEMGWAEVGGRMIRNQHSEVAGDETISRTVWLPRYDWWAGKPDGINEARAQKAVDKALAGERLGAAEQRMIDYMLDIAEQRKRSSAWLPTADDLAAANLEPPDALLTAMVARAAGIDEARVERLAIQYENDDAGFMAGIKEILDEADQNPAITSPRQADAPAQGTKAAKAEAGGQAQEVAQPPDMPVRVTDDGQVVKLADEMQAAEKFAAEGDDANLGELDAPLLQVAAECFLTTGAAL